MGTGKPAIISKFIEVSLSGTLFAAMRCSCSVGVPRASCVKMASALSRSSMVTSRESIILSVGSLRMRPKR